MAKKPFMVSCKVTATGWCNLMVKAESKEEAEKKFKDGLKDPDTDHSIYFDNIDWTDEDYTDVDAVDYSDTNLADDTEFVM